MLSQQNAVEQARMLFEWRRAEAETLERAYSYLRGRQPNPIVPAGAPEPVVRLARKSRINLVKLIVTVPAQALSANGYRAGGGTDDAEGWETWQANKMDARQTGVYRAAIAYGASYVSVLPGEPRAVLKGISPRYCTAVYGEDDDWPMFALERLRGRRQGPISSSEPALYRLYDEEGVYTVTDEDGGKYIDSQVHGLGVTPVVRFRNVHDLDDEQVGTIDDSLMAMQDQFDITTFGLLTAQHYQAFRQRAIMGWLAPDENSKLKAGASELWTFEDADTKVVEFGQVDLSGYLSSRESLVELFAVVTQTPPQHILGKLVNISAEALVAANLGQERLDEGLQVSFGESDEQMLNLAAAAEGREPDDSAQMVWRDAAARSLAQTVDAMGKIAAQLEVPPQMLWERLPGVTQTDVERWRKAWQERKAEGPPPAPEEEFAVL